MNPINKHNQKIRRKRIKKNNTRRFQSSTDNFICKGLPIIQKGDYLIGGDGEDSEQKGILDTITQTIISIKNFFARILKNSYRTMKEFFSVLKELTILLLKTFFVVDYDMLFPIRTPYTEYQKNIIEIMKYFYARACSPPYIRFSQLFTLFSILKEYRDESGWKSDTNEFELVDPVDPSNLDEFKPIYHKKYQNKDRSSLFSKLTKEVLQNPLKLDLMQDIIEGMEGGMEFVKDSSAGIIDNFKRAFNLFMEFCSQIYNFFKEQGKSAIGTIKSIFSIKKRGGKKLGGKKFKKRIRIRKIRGGGTLSYLSKVMQDSTESLKQKSLMLANKAKASTEYVGNLLMSERARKQARLRYFVDRYVAIGNEHIKEKKAGILSNVIIKLYLLSRGVGASEFKNDKAITSIQEFFNKTPYANKEQNPEFYENISLFIKINNLRLKDKDYYSQLSKILQVDETDLETVVPISDDIEDKTKFHNYLLKKITSAIEQNIIDNVSLINRRNYKIKVKRGFTIDVKYKDIWRPAIVDQVVLNKKEDKTEKDTYTFIVKLKDGNDTPVTFNTRDTELIQNSIMEHFDRFVPGQEDDPTESENPITTKEEPTNVGGGLNFFTKAVYIDKSNETYNDRFPMIPLITDIKRVSQFKSNTIKQIHRIIDGFGIKRENVIRLNNIERVSYKIEEMDFYNKILKDCIDDLLLASDIRFQPIVRKIALDNIIYGKRNEGEIDTFHGFKTTIIGVPSVIDEGELVHIEDGIIGRINKYYRDKLDLDKSFYEAREKISFQSEVEWDSKKEELTRDIKLERDSLLHFLVGIDHKKCVDLLFTNTGILYDSASFRNKRQSFREQTNIIDREIKGGAGEDEKNLLSAIAGYHSHKIKEEKERIQKEKVEEPVVEEPAVEEPAVEEPAVEEPVVEEPAVEEPVVEEPASIEGEQQPEEIAKIGKSAHKVLLKFLNEVIDEELYDATGSYSDKYGPNVSHRLYNEATSRTLFTRFLQEDVKNRVESYIHNLSMEELNSIIKSDNINKRNKILSEHIIDIWDMYQATKPYQSNKGSFGSINSNVKNAILKGLDEKFRDTFRELLLSGTDEEFASVLSSISQIMVISPLLAVCMTMQTDVLVGRFSPGCILSALTALHFIFNITCTTSIIPPEMKDAINELNAGLEKTNKANEESIQKADARLEKKEDAAIENQSLETNK
jgi:hypothetical protein